MMKHYTNDVFEFDHEIDSLPLHLHRGGRFYYKSFDNKTFFMGSEPGLSINLNKYHSHSTFSIHNPDVEFVLSSEDKVYMYNDDGKLVEITNPEKFNNITTTPEKTLVIYYVFGMSKETDIMHMEDNLCTKYEKVNGFIFGRDIVCREILGKDFQPIFRINLASYYKLPIKGKLYEGEDYKCIPFSNTTITVRSDFSYVIYAPFLTQDFKITINGLVYDARIMIVEHNIERPVLEEIFYDKPDLSKHVEVPIMRGESESKEMHIAFKKCVGREGINVKDLTKKEYDLMFHFFLEYLGEHKDSFVKYDESSQNTFFKYYTMKVNDMLQSKFNTTRQAMYASPQQRLESFNFAHYKRHNPEIFDRGVQCSNPLVNVEGCDYKVDKYQRRVENTYLVIIPIEFKINPNITFIEIQGAFSMKTKDHFVNNASNKSINKYLEEYNKLSDRKLENNSDSKDRNISEDVNDNNTHLSNKSVYESLKEKFNSEEMRAAELPADFAKNSTYYTKLNWTKQQDTPYTAPNLSLPNEMERVKSLSVNTEIPVNRDAKPDPEVEKIKEKALERLRNEVGNVYKLKPVEKLEDIDDIFIKTNRDEKHSAMVNSVINEFCMHEDKDYDRVYHVQSGCVYLVSEGGFCSGYRFITPKDCAPAFDISHRYETEFDLYKVFGEEDVLTFESDTPLNMELRESRYLKIIDPKPMTQYNINIHYKFFHPILTVHTLMAYDTKLRNEEVKVNQHYIFIDRDAEKTILSVASFGGNLINSCRWNQVPMPISEDRTTVQINVNLNFNDGFNKMLIVHKENHIEEHIDVWAFKQMQESKIYFVQNCKTTIKNIRIKFTKDLEDFIGIKPEFKDENALIRRKHIYQQTKFKIYKDNIVKGLNMYVGLIKLPKKKKENHRDILSGKLQHPELEEWYVGAKSFQYEYTNLEYEIAFFVGTPNRFLENKYMEWEEFPDKEFEDIGYFDFENEWMVCYKDGIYQGLGVNRKFVFYTPTYTETYELAKYAENLQDEINNQFGVYFKGLVFAGANILNATETGLRVNVTANEAFIYAVPKGFHIMIKSYKKPYALVKYNGVVVNEQKIENYQDKPDQEMKEPIYEYSLSVRHRNSKTVDLLVFTGVKYEKVRLNMLAVPVKSTVVSPIHEIELPPDVELERGYFKLNGFLTLLKNEETSRSEGNNSILQFSNSTYGIRSPLFDYDNAKLYIPEFNERSIKSFLFKKVVKNKIKSDFKKLWDTKVKDTQFDDPDKTLNKYYKSLFFKPYNHPEPSGTEVDYTVISNENANLLRRFFMDVPETYETIYHFIDNSKFINTDFHIMKPKDVVIPIGHESEIVTVFLPIVPNERSVNDNNIENNNGSNESRHDNNLTINNSHDENNNSYDENNIGTKEINTETEIVKRDENNIENKVIKRDEDGLDEADNDFYNTMMNMINKVTTRDGDTTLTLPLEEYNQICEINDKITKLREEQEIDLSDIKDPSPEEMMLMYKAWHLDSMVDCRLVKAVTKPGLYIVFDGEETKFINVLNTKTVDHIYQRGIPFKVPEMLGVELKNDALTIEKSTVTIFETRIRVIYVKAPDLEYYVRMNVKWNPEKPVYEFVTYNATFGDLDLKEYENVKSFQDEKEFFIVNYTIRDVGVFYQEILKGYTDITDTRDVSYMNLRHNKKYRDVVDFRSDIISKLDRLKFRETTLEAEDEHRLKMGKAIQDAFKKHNPDKQLFVINETLIETKSGIVGYIDRKLLDYAVNVKVHLKFPDGSDYFMGAYNKHAKLFGSTKPAEITNVKWMTVASNGLNPLIELDHDVNYCYAMNYAKNELYGAILSSIDFEQCKFERLDTTAATETIYELSWKPFKVEEDSKLDPSKSYIIIPTLLIYDPEINNPETTRCDPTEDIDLEEIIARNLS